MFDPRVWKETLEAARAGEKDAGDRVARMVVASGRHALRRWREKDLDAEELIGGLLEDVCPGNFACLADAAPECVEAYIAVALRHRWAQTLRSKMRRAAHESSEGITLEEYAADGRDPQKLAELRLLVRDIQTRVAQMEAKYQQIFHRFFVAGQSLREIADELKLSVGTVGWCIHRIRAELKPLFDGDTPSGKMTGQRRNTREGGVIAIKTILRRIGRRNRHGGRTSENSQRIRQRGRPLRHLSK